MSDFAKRTQDSLDRVSRGTPMIVYSLMRYGHAESDIDDLYGVFSTVENAQAKAESTTPGLVWVSEPDPNNPNDVFMTADVTEHEYWCIVDNTLDA